MNALHRDLKKLTSMVESMGAERTARDPWRMRFHLMPPVGWLNDPNGLCQLHGVYHVFFQYAPFEVKGGLKFWGHYRSRDLVNWEYMGPALYADQPFDCHGVYSGSALIEEDGMHLFYTGNVKHPGTFDFINEGRSADTVYVYSRDGVHFEAKERLMTNSDYPRDCTCHVRDPKVWRDGDVYRMVQGARRKGADGPDRGEILLFTSRDKKHWSLKNRITTQERFGYMWECPDYFRLEGQQFLVCCPQGVKQDDLERQNLYQNGYFPVEGSLEGACGLGSFQTLDYGFDFYAPQTFEDERGRRILIGWAGMPDVDYENPTTQAGWQHCLTVPRVLTLRDGKLLQNPIPELQALRGEEEEANLGGGYRKEGLTSYEAWMEWDSPEQVQLCFRDQRGGQATLEYDASTGIAVLHLKGELAAGRDRRRVRVGDLKNLRILADASILELYFNDGEKVLTTRYYPKDGRSSLEVEAAPGTIKLWTY